VDPDPYDDVAVAAYKDGSLTSFARHSRLGATNLDTPEQVQESFKQEVDRLRTLGFKRISLKTGAYGNEALAMSIRLAAETKLDLLTIDGAGGGTGMSPWNMMEHWGVPSLHLHAKTYEYCKILADKGMDVPDISLAGGFAREDHLFKAIALGAPYTRLVCMGRAPMIPGYLGSNIQGVLEPEKRQQLNGRWDELPKTVTDLGKTAKGIFAGYEAVEAKVGADEMKNIPYGAIAMYGYADKLACGLQQFMAGARKFSLGEISRDDLFAGNRETAELTGLEYMAEAEDDAAKRILNA
jgi:glutamate synthase domain-containing protein 2